MDVFFYVAPDLTCGNGRPKYTHVLRKYYHKYLLRPFSFPKHLRYGARPIGANKWSVTAETVCLLRTRNEYFIFFIIYEARMHGQLAIGTW